MPRDRSTPRRRILRFLCLLGIVFAIDYHEELHHGLFDPDPTTLIDILTLIEWVQSVRYTVPRLPISRSNELRVKALEEYSPEYFNAILGLYPAQFNTLVNLIKDHPVFQKSSTGRPQATIRDQLKVALLRIAKGQSNHSVMSQMRCAKGSVITYTSRCIEAIASLERKFIIWPDAAERQAISKAFAAVGFPGCIGAIDGTSFPFEVSPSFQTKAWNTRKCEYAMGATVVCDDKKRIRLFLTGYHTKYSDSTAYDFTELPRYPSLFFDDDQYLLADCDYPLRPRIITGFRECDLSDPQNKMFTDAHAKARVVIENTFGDLKSRIQSLRRIPLHVESEKDLNKAVKWCVTGAVLHNFALLCDKVTGELRDPSNNFLNEAGPHLEEHHRRLSTSPDFLVSNSGLSF